MRCCTGRWTCPAEERQRFIDAACAGDRTAGAGPDPVGRASKRSTSSWNPRSRCLPSPGQHHHRSDIGRGGKRPARHAGDLDAGRYSSRAPPFSVRQHLGVCLLVAGIGAALYGMRAKPITPARSPSNASSKAWLAHAMCCSSSTTPSTRVRGSAQTAGECCAPGPIEPIPGYAGPAARSCRRLRAARRDHRHAGIVCRSRAGCAQRTHNEAGSPASARRAAQPAAGKSPARWVVTARRDSAASNAPRAAG